MSPSEVITIDHSRQPAGKMMPLFFGGGGGLRWGERGEEYSLWVLIHFLQKDKENSAYT